jgi:hypothetical protein
MTGFIGSPDMLVQYAIFSMTSRDREVSDNSVAALPGGLVVVVQHASQALPSAHRARGSRPREWVNQRVPESLVVAVRVVVRHEFRQGAPNMALADHNYAIQAFLVDRAHEPLREGVAVRSAPASE